LRDVGRAVVRIRRREVREDLAAVVSLPDERVVLGSVEPVPRELLREEARDAGPAHDLRQLAVEPERVGRPELRAAKPELALEEALPVEELPHERLARRQVEIRL